MSLTKDRVNTSEVGAVSSLPTLTTQPLTTYAHDAESGVPITGTFCNAAPRLAWTLHDIDISGEDASVQAVCTPRLTHNLASKPLLTLGERRTNGTQQDQIRQHRRHCHLTVAAIS